MNQDEKRRGKRKRLLKEGILSVGKNRLQTAHKGKNILKGEGDSLGKYPRITHSWSKNPTLGHSTSIITQNLRASREQSSTIRRGPAS